MYHNALTDNDSKNPEIIWFSNATKSGVEVLDEKCATYLTSRRTWRWLVILFHAILNNCKKPHFVPISPGR